MSAINNERILTFHIHRYHLLPISSVSSQTSAFPIEHLEPSEIRARKNEFFSAVLDKLKNDASVKYPLKVEARDGNYVLLKLAQKKLAIITKDFVSTQIENEPFVYVIINNDPQVQKIAISENADAFSSTTVVQNILEKLFQGMLQEYGLNIKLEKLFSSDGFWKLISKHQHDLKLIDFKFIKPNLANISKALPEAFRNLTEVTNSHESHIRLKAPDKGTLENISKDELAIAGLVEYASEGAGNIKVKVKKIRKMISTKESPVVQQVTEVSIEGTTEQVIKVYQSLVDE